MKRALLSVIGAALAGALLLACTSGEAPPSEGVYTVQFPSTAAAVATDYVQVFVYDFPPDQRAFACSNLIAARKHKDTSTKPLLIGPQVNVCELLNGAKPITVPFGEMAVMAVGLRKTDDFLVGCVIETFGAGDAELAIPLELIDLTVPVPVSACTSVSDRCKQVCVAM
jgi:hypothetical protein